MPETVRIVPRPWTLLGTLAGTGSVTPLRLSMKLTPTMPPTSANTMVTTRARSATSRPCLAPERSPYALRRNQPYEKCQKEG